MRLFSIVSTIVSIISGRHIDITNTENIVNAHMFYRREDTTFPVVYESHEPLSVCYDMRSDTMSIDDEELQAYADLSDDIDVHNIHTNQSIVLYDVLCIDYRHSLIHIDRAHSKDIVYNINTNIARILNKQKFSDNYKHKKVTHHTVGYNEYIENGIFLILSSMLKSPVDMLTIARNMHRYDISRHKIDYNIRNILSNASFVFSVNNYIVVIHNADTVLFDVQRILARKRVCVMCISARLINNKDNHGDAEYINIHNGTHYTHNIEYDVHNYYYPHYYPYISVQDGMLNAMSGMCVARHTHIASVSNNMNTDMLSYTVSLSTVAIIVSVILFKPLKKCIRKLLSVIPLNEKNRNITQEREYDALVA